MSKIRELKRQSVFSVRITNHVDDGFLAWVNQVHGQGLLQRMALEGLYLQYSKELSIPGRWVPTLNKTMMEIPREILSYITTNPDSIAEKVQYGEPEAQPPARSSLGEQIPVQSTPVAESPEDSGTNSAENPALQSAFDFLNDD